MSELLTPATDDGVDAVSPAQHPHYAAIEAIVLEAQPAVRQDGGDIALVSIRDDIVRVRLTGACTHCAMAGHTLGGVRRRIMQRLGLNLRVLPVPLDD